LLEGREEEIRRMKLALFMMPIHDPKRDYHTTLMEDVETVVLADRLGYEEVWVGEHYTSSAEQITNPMMFLAACISRTKNIKLGTGVICLPQYNPVVVAGQAALFDHLSKGRFLMGVGPGGLPSDFEVFGTMESDRNEMMLEAVDVIHKIWAGNPPYDIKGKYYNVSMKTWVYEDIGMGYMAKPYQKPYPKVALSAMSPYSGSIRSAAQRDWDPISANFIGNWSVKSHWEVYADETRKQGRTPDPERWRVARNIYVDETDVAAEKFVRKRHGSYDHYFEYLHKIFGRAHMLAPFVVNKGDDPEKLRYETLRDNFTLYGSPQTVARKILEFREEVGHFGTLMLTSQDWTNRAKIRRSMARLAKEVMPMVNAAIGGDAKSRAAE
jgi:alkanesulfonate monooxygenase SsuD/methylene tetrahydromethanopterin reductase-like flavin-dependent oxidoreductase (luciferase family)